MFEDMLEKIHTNKVVVGLGGLVILLLMTCLFLLRNPSKETQEELLPSWSGQSETISSTTMPSKEGSQAEKSQSSTMITVDVKGAVKKPGVYDLPSGSRVNDAILLAGGLREDADRKSVNFAQKLSDEGIVYVASQGENISVINSSVAPQNSTDSSEVSTGKVDLNRATLADLQTISGIGQKRAQDIIDYRDSNGGFKSVDDLSNVSGIGDKTLEKLREEVTVD
ncbi:helix-hairpin-helix domain-containing protein [Streptococcus halotolerans]|uniref:helix-hairpin-helix domain-containing protein n=1 Tax=Streptococcus halotolerans TaxID=1814128 RepID=UPI00078939A6|nr:helix-hairpin-helix domain-containing protein [Streptococcus halotolerans]